MNEPATRVLPTLTRDGATAVAAAVVLVAIGWALGYEALTVVGVAAAIAVAIGWAVAYSVPTLEVARTIQPTRVERANPAFGLLEVRNAASRRSRPCHAVETIAPGPDIVVAIPSLRPDRAVSVPYRIPTHRRGTLSIGPLAIERRDPLGLWHARRPLGRAVTLLVQPHVTPLDPRPSGRARHIDGPVSNDSTKGTQTFHSLREYTPGDDIRHVHWRSTARTGTMMVREHVDTSEPTTVVVLDLRAERYRGDRFEEAVDVVASVAAASQDRRFPVRVVTSTGRSVAVRSGQRGGELADFLTSVQPLDEAAGDLGQAAIEVLRGREHDAIVVVTGSVDAADLAATSALTRRFARPTLVTIADTDVERWRGGNHLAGLTAIEALGRWQMPEARAPRPSPAGVST